jgi:hypothetical protein
MARLPATLAFPTPHDIEGFGDPVGGPGLSIPFGRICIAAPAYGEPSVAETGGIRLPTLPLAYQPQALTDRRTICATSP